MVTESEYFVTHDNLGQVAAQLNAWVNGSPLDVSFSSEWQCPRLYGTVGFSAYNGGISSSGLCIKIDGMYAEYHPSPAELGEGPASIYVYPNHSVITCQLGHGGLILRIVSPRADQSTYEESLWLRPMLPCPLALNLFPLELTSDTIASVAGGMSALFSGKSFRVTRSRQGEKSHRWVAELAPASLTTGNVVTGDPFWMSDGGTTDDLRFYVSTQPRAFRRERNRSRTTLIHRFGLTQPGTVLWKEDGVTISAYDERGRHVVVTYELYDPDA